MAKKVKKNKLKTHKGTVKVLNVRQSGSITTGHPGANNNTGKHSTKTSRKKRTSNALSNSDLKRIKSII